MRQGFGIESAEVWWLMYANFIVGGVLAALAAMCIGYPTLKLRGDYLAIMTLGFGEIIRIVAINWVDLTRGRWAFAISRCQTCLVTSWPALRPNTFMRWRWRPWWCS
ncbi:hypothetical protein P4131_12105 [Pseudomonas aeruginosa]|nr:hypothetical protein [Pseudomonas aeruginosa]